MHRGTIVLKQQQDNHLEAKEKLRGIQPCYHFDLGLSLQNFAEMGMECVNTSNDPTLWSGNQMLQMILLLVESNIGSL